VAEARVAASQDLKFPDAALRETTSKAIASQGKTIATAKSTTIQREKTKWTARRSALRETADVFSFSKSTDKVVFPSGQPEIPTGLLLQDPDCDPCPIRSIYSGKGPLVWLFRLALK
jgi:hypothetical protein